jgi:hypothetical protein
MDLLKAVKADGVLIYGCAVEAALTGITEKIPPEIELLPYEDLKIWYCVVYGVWGNLSFFK